ncbi:hypothetical protein P9E76_02515 [Schinkia azotoformans]|uniref:Uncharacterized protein n=1 Tax=Schinkia azotoformans LMG 9581 TaxID=1131731 RepID=K6DHA0_SCHAZ|nr:hypothetical protein [Schinkia azotoformans]EKN67684.1 hypothetical protein BAZO_07379 [Schinkia azotoformans LMG 9581]MEC1637544.1 hypothetical protein [Schinkia azotoformans]MEC1718881.1 hypothetical protein [Schinkia azotoformans]MEC1943948.1 hypothetical protein [Schinkia azotoformans]MED4412907.1 hypothetical protein [Schinkia azotoformans]
MTTDAHFPENALVRLIGSIRSIFDPSKEMTLNETLKTKVAEIRSLMSEGYIPFIKCVCLSNGLAWNTQGQEQIDNSGFSSDQVVLNITNMTLL